MTKTINNRKNMTTQELEAVSGGVVPWAAISVGIAAAKLTYEEQLLQLMISLKRLTSSASVQTTLHR